MRLAGVPIVVNGDIGEFAVIHASARQLFVRDRKSQRFDQMQARAGIDGEANRVAGVGRNFRFVEDDVKHGASAF